MKIAMIGLRGVPASYGGIERHVEEIGKRLVLKGHEVLVYTRPHMVSGSGPYLGMERKPLPSLNTKHLDTATHALLSTLDVLRSGVDIVHFHALGPSSLSWLPRLRGIPVVATLHGLDWERDKWGAMASYLLEKCEFPAIHFPDRTIVVSKVLQHYFEEKYLIRPVYIPNGVNVPRLESPSLLAQWSLTPEGYYLFFGRLVPEKGAHFLIEAFSKLKTDRKLVIAGGFSASDAYSERLRRGAGDNVVFTGFLQGENLGALLSHAYTVVLPSTLEGLSIALLEALSYHRCTLVSDIPENLEVIEERMPTFPSEDVDCLVQELQTLERDPGLVSSYEAKAQALSSRFQWDVVVDSLLGVYDAVIQGKDSSTAVPPVE